MDRIDLIASLARGSNVLCDIGCDHAYSIIKALKYYNVSKAIASDINQGPLDNAKNNIYSEGLESRVDFIKSDGFSDINSFFDTAIISGMGGNLIIDILSKGLDKIKGKKLIISANCDSFLVRKYLTKNGFYIKDEYAIYDSNKYYEIMVFEEGKVEYASFELKYGPILLAKKTEDYIKEYESRLKKIDEIIPNIKDTIQKDEKIVLRNDYRKILHGDSTKMIPILDTDNYYREYFIDDKKRPLIVVSAGGAYKYTSPRESEPIKDFYFENGYHVVIVNYRESLGYFPEPQNMLSYVIKKFENDERVSKVIVIGFSAGGHNALEVALHPSIYNVKVDLLILAYPVVTADPKYAHVGSFENLIGNFTDKKLLDRLSEEKEVTDAAPELFLWGTYTDESVDVMNSLLLIEAYKKYDINVEYHLYPMGGHGLSLASSRSSYGEADKEIEHVSEWAYDSLKWLDIKLNRM